MRTWPLGLACVAAAVRQAGHDVELLDMMDSRDSKSLIEDSIRSFLPELIGISVRNIDNQTMENPVFLLEQSKEVAQSLQSLLRRAHCPGRRWLQHVPGKCVGIRWTRIWEYRGRANWRFRPSWNK